MISLELMPGADRFDPSHLHSTPFTEHFDPREEEYDGRRLAVGIALSVS